MEKKTLVISHKSVTAQELSSSLFDEFEKHDGYYEGSYYIISWLFYDFEAERIELSFKCDNEESIEESVERLAKTKYRIVEGSIEREYSAQLEVVECLLSEKNVDRVIWYTGDSAPFIETFALFYNLTDWQGIKHSFCFETYGEYGAFLPVTELKTERIMKRYFETARCSCIREHIFSCYFARVIEILYKKLYEACFDHEINELNDYYLCILSIVYEHSDRYFNSGSLILEQNNLIAMRLPDRYDGFPLYSSFDNASSAMKDLSKYGLINVNAKTQKISHTEFGRRVYEIVKKYIPEAMSIKQFVYWRKHSGRIINGKMSGEEYMEEAEEYVKKLIMKTRAK